MHTPAWIVATVVLLTSALAFAETDLGSQAEHQRRFAARHLRNARRSKQSSPSDQHGGPATFHRLYDQLVATKGSDASVKRYQAVTDKRLHVALQHRGNPARGEIMRRDAEADKAAMLARRRRAMPSASSTQYTCPRRPAGHSGFAYGQIAELHMSNVTGATLKATIRERGAVIIRGLVPPAESAALVDMIDNVFDGVLEERRCNRGAPQRCGAFERRTTERSLFPKFDVYAEDLLKGSGVFAVHSPSAVEHVLQLYQQLGLQRLMRGFFDDEPAIASKKMVLRRGNGVNFPSWHQDGAFMAQGETYLNMWLSLTECGANTGAAGLTLSPKRRANLLRPMFPGATRAYLGILLNHSAIIEEKPVSPGFGVGDALIFDGYLVHSTQFDFGASDWGSMRHAIETWFHPRCAVNNGYSCPLAWGW